MDKITKAKAGASVPPANIKKTPGYKKLRDDLKKQKSDMISEDAAKKKANMKYRRDWEI